MIGKPGARATHIMGRAHPRKAPPKGVMQADGRIKIATCFDRTNFDKICKMSQVERKGFYEMINYIVACGILCLEESDQHEKKSA